jgi:hypothetical protein
MTWIRTLAGPLLLWLAASGTVAAMHPAVGLLDADGKNVLDSDRPVSTMRTCGACHDTKYIAAHSYHVSLGSDERSLPGQVPGGRPWDWSPGAFGRWNPLFYRYLSPPGDARLDLTTEAWIAIFPRHVGGGPALIGESQKNTGVELNCFLCHIAKPDNQARLNELRKSRFSWANTATLAATGLVHPAKEGWSYNHDAFLPDGKLDADNLGLREPRSANCGLCHGLADRSNQPLKLDLALQQWATATKGQVFSPQRISDSGVNIVDKEHLARSWDVHAERLLECSSCHFSLNNPAFYEPTPRSRPQHLKFEPRRLAPGEYIQQPSHQFAKGHTAQGTLARHLDGTMRRCEDCHNAQDTHGWLPYQEAHFARLSCEACHIPQVYAPAIRQVDWTLLTPSGEPRIQWRGIDGDPSNPTALVRGFSPVLLPASSLDGRNRLVPHNLVTAWYWVEGGNSPRPVRLADLKSAMIQDGKYHPKIAGVLGEAQATLDTPEKVEAVRKRLVAVGVVEPRIEAEVQPYSLHHGVGPAKWATRRCETCHAERSRLGEPFVLASYVPGGVVPKAVDDSETELRGYLQIGDGQLTYRPSTTEASLYILGHNHRLWVNALGGLSLAGVVLGVVIHAGMRVKTARRTAAIFSRASLTSSPSPLPRTEESQS